MSGDWSGILTVINLTVTILIVIGGYIALKSGIARTAQEVQERVISALHEENELLQNRIKRAEAENSRLNRLVLLIIGMLKKMHNISVEIEQDMVTFRSSSGVQVSQLPSTDDPLAPPSP